MDNWEASNFSERDHVFYDHITNIEESLNNVQDSFSDVVLDVDKIKKMVKSTNESINALETLMRRWFENSCADSTEVFVYDKTPKHYVKSLDECNIKGNHCFQRFSLYDFDEKGFKIYSGEKYRDAIVKFFLSVQEGDVIVFDNRMFFENPRLVDVLVPLLTFKRFTTHLLPKDNLYDQEFESQLSESDDSDNLDVLEQAIARITRIQPKLDDFDHRALIAESYKIGVGEARKVLKKMVHMGILGFNQPREVCVSELQWLNRDKPIPNVSICFVGNYSLLPEEIRNLLDGVYIKTKE